mmetsp:Transcript_39066/g.102415  ORF Transcript_39066/g.102415 Transcript_39066/m.102415 type:complete len:269 (-) Transcript_39066:559-1365(-)
MPLAWLKTRHGHQVARFSKTGQLLAARRGPQSCTSTGAYLLHTLWQAPVRRPSFYRPPRGGRPFPPRGGEASCQKCSVKMLVIDEMSFRGLSKAHTQLRNIVFLAGGRAFGAPRLLLLGFHRRQQRQPLGGDDGLPLLHQLSDVRRTGPIGVIQRRPPQLQLVDGTHRTGIPFDASGQVVVGSQRRHRCCHRGGDRDIPRGVGEVPQRGRGDGAHAQYELPEAPPAVAHRDALLVERHLPPQAELDVFLGSHRGLVVVDGLGLLGVGG